MNQNRNNNRRRGRGNNRGGPGGGGIQGNRIDSRARGNAPQMLEKYRKLAHDASLNGDRVQTEYYLQFADHYFRVVADSRTQQNEQRPRRDDQQSSSSYDNDGYDSDDRDERDDAPQGQPPRGPVDRDDDERSSPEQGARASEGEETDNATSRDNPFIRDARESQARESQGRDGQARDGQEREGRGEGQRSAPRSRGRGRPPGKAGPSEEAGPSNEAATVKSTGRKPRERIVSNDDASFDPGLLPPSIPRDEEPAPRPARGRRRARPVVDGDDEALEAVN